MPIPTVAPPMVMCFSSGVTGGRKPSGKQCATMVSKVARPSTSSVRVALSSAITSLNWPNETRCTGADADW